MPKTKSSSSSLPTSAGSRSTGQLAKVPLDRLVPYPANPNIMDEELLEKLAANIRREDDYEPIAVRPDPGRRGYYQILNGHQRWEVLCRLGHEEALCYVWPCDDEAALLLLATLNTLRGQDDPLKRAELLKELSGLAAPEELARILPESATLIHQTLEILDLDLDSLLAYLQKDAGSGSGLRAISFAVTPEDEAVIEEAVRLVAADLDGANRRGRALAIIANSYLERRSG